MRKIDKLLLEYGESHQNLTNKLIHWICVPIIFFSIIGLIWSIPSGFLEKIYHGPYSAFFNWATIALVIVLLYYLSLSPALFLGMLIMVIIFTAIIYFIDRFVPIPLWAISISLFLLAWIGQFYGHKVEGKKPSFFKDLQFLLIGPAWIMSFLYKKLGLKY